MHRFILRLLCIGILSGGSITVYSQTSLIDSLEREITRLDLPDTVRVNYLNVLAREYTYISAAKAYTYANEALQLSLQTQYRTGEAYAYRNLGSSYAAQEYFYGTSAFVEKAMTIFEELADSVGLGNCYITIGHAYKRQQDFAKSVEFHARAVQIFRQKRLQERLGVSLHNLGESQMLAGQLESARANTAEAIQILQSVNHLPVLTACYKVMGIIAYKENNLPAAETAFRQALAISESLGKNSQKEATTESLIYLARIAQQNGQPAAELTFLRRAIALAKENNYVRMLRDASMELVNFYLRKNDLTSAQLFLREYSSLNDSLISYHNRDKAAMLEPMIHSIKTEAENKRLQTERQLSQELIERQRTQLVFYFIITLLLIGTLSLFMYFGRERRKLTESILEQKKLIEEKSVKLEAINATKDKFFSIVSHDLKTPLNSLQAFLMLLNEHMDDFTPEEMQSLISDLNKNLLNTIDLADNLIVWARSQMNTDQIVPVEIRVADLTGKVINLCRNVVEQKQIHVILRVADDTQVWADPDQAEFVLRNLVNNAIKFTPRGGRIELSADYESSEAVCIRVMDSGKGIPEEMLGSLFVPGKNRSRRGTEGEQGTGLGLILCKEFVEKNKGRISVQNVAGSGAAIRICLPSVPA
jgi:signal transduction histidine kinase